jgi:hypothetical protein
VGGRKMKDSCYKKSLVLGVIVIFIGVGFIPSINGYIVGDFDKISNQSINYAPIGAPLNNNFVQAYWKFDEGSGNILEDSSGNDFDGTINGATWTGGNSGYALDFDGTDDYVDLDSYSTDLGFNKTDDLIFSFCFFAKPSDAGMIFCFAGTQHVPEALIQLCSNGSLEFKIWTTVCGINCFSDENHNDETWHYVEAYFNGVTCKPTIEIYVDDDLEGSKIKWLCEIESNEFYKAKIGRRGWESSDYFGGLIDEFKIIKYPGGNDQVPPDISGQTSGYPGVEYFYSFITNDPEEDDIELYIDWGDGTIEDWFGPFESGEEVIVGHTYNETGTYGIRAKSQDYWEDSPPSTPYEVKIGNGPPNIPTIDGPTSGVINIPYEYSIVTTEPDGDDVYYYIDWGDGTNSGWVGPYQSEETIVLSHTWKTPGTYEIKGKAKDVYNEESDWTEIIDVTILYNEPPITPTINGQTNGKIGTPYTYKIRTTDPDGDKVYYWINWGDGTNSDWLGSYNSGEEIEATHTWNNEGTFTIEVKAKDTNEAESDWGKLDVTMPKNKQSTNPLLIRLLEIFPILKNLYYLFL